MTTLYHYCSNEVFKSIIETKSIWLSSVTLANDTMEGRLVSNRIKELAIRDGLSLADIQRLAEQLEHLETFVDGLCFCLSEKGDVLSQWRGYASDATGVSLGFSKSYLSQLKESQHAKEYAFYLQQVLYDEEMQLKVLEPAYAEIKKYIQDGAFRKHYKALLEIKTDEEIQAENEKTDSAFKALTMSILPLVTQLFILKNSAFAEEREWRLISFLIKDMNVVPCSFRAVKDRLIPYFCIKLDEIGVPPISEVILGPKNQTPDYVVKALLAQNGFKDVAITRSVATYR